MPQSQLYFDKFDCSLFKQKKICCSKAKHQLYSIIHGCWSLTKINNLNRLKKTQHNNPNKS
jgi:hypothetical protein